MHVFACSLDFLIKILSPLIVIFVGRSSNANIVSLLGILVEVVRISDKSGILFVCDYCSYSDVALCHNFLLNFHQLSSLAYA